MKIRTRLTLNTIVACMLVLVLVLFFVQFRRLALATDRKLALVEEMGKNAFERTVLRDEYLVNHSERAKVQWKEKTGQFRLLLERAEGEFTESADRRTLEEIGKAFEESIPIFYKLVEIADHEAESPKDSLLLSEGQKRLVSQLLLKAHVRVSRVDRLRAKVKRQADEAKDNLHLLFLVLVAAVVVTTIGNSVLINGLLARRLGLLRKGAEITGRGDLNHRIAVPGNDELSDLAREYNEMAARLKETYTSVDNLRREVAGRIRAERDLQELNRELEQRVRERTAQLDASNKELESFAYSVSHDLRAPLRGIDGWSLALVEDYGGKLDDQARTYLQRVRSESQRMGRLIDDLLNLSRVTRSEMQSEPVDLSSMAARIAEGLREGAQQRRIEFVIQPALSAVGDPQLLEIALFNLLDNAVKFTGKEPLARIEFGQVDADGEKSFFVRDNGAGFNMAYVSKLFGAFQRLHKSVEFPGTGIGLATVQRIVRRHGGRIWAEANVNQGAVFYFTLKEAV